MTLPRKILRHTLEALRDFAREPCRRSNCGSVCLCGPCHARAALPEVENEAAPPELRKDRRKLPKSPETIKNIKNAASAYWQRAADFAKHFGCSRKDAADYVMPWFDRDLQELVAQGLPWAIKKARREYGRTRPSTFPPLRELRSRA
jgi:hypothetical protein